MFQGQQSSGASGSVPLKQITWNDAYDKLQLNELTRGFYKVTNRPNTGTDVLIIEALASGGSVNSLASIERKKSSRGTIQIGDNTGKSGTSQIYINNERVDDGTINFDGDAQTSAEIATMVANSISGGGIYTAFAVGDTVYIDSTPENGKASNGFTVEVRTIQTLTFTSASFADNTTVSGNNGALGVFPNGSVGGLTNSTVIITNSTNFSGASSITIDGIIGSISLDSAIGDDLISTITNMQGGGLFDHACIYNFLTDSFFSETDTCNNVIYSESSNNVDIMQQMPFLDNTSLGDNNNMFFCQLSNFTGSLYKNIFSGYSILVALNSNCLFQYNEVLGDNTVLDISNLQLPTLISNSIFRGKQDNSTIYINENCIAQNIDYSTGISTIEKQFQQDDDNKFNFDEDVYHHCAGVCKIDGDAGNLKGVLNLVVAVKNINLQSKAGTVLTIDWTDTDNIQVSDEVKALWDLMNPGSTEISINSDNGDFATCINDGINLIITKITTF